MNVLLLQRTTVLLCLLFLACCAAPNRAMPIAVIQNSGEFHRGGDRVAVLTDDWFYCYTPTNTLYRVPRSYVTDFASIPPVGRFLIAPFGRHAEGAVVHDFLYAVGERNGRDRADDVLRRAMVEQGVDGFRVGVVTWSVSQFGGNSYGKIGEWNDNFAMPYEPYSRIAPPLARPATAAVAQVDCNWARLHLLETQIRYRSYTPSAGQMVDEGYRVFCQNYESPRQCLGPESYQVQVTTESEVTTLQYSSHVDTEGAVATFSCRYAGHEVECAVPED